MDKEDALRKFGLTEIETKVYLDLLRTGSAKVHILAQKTNLPRTTVYGILDSLISKGLVSHTIVSGVKLFQASEPEILLSILKEKEKYIENVLPELQKIKKSVKEKPKVEIYEGKEGIKSIMEDLIRTKKPVVSFSSTKDIFNLLNFYTPQFIKKRVKAGIKIRLLTEKTSTVGQVLKKKDKQELRETRFMPKIGEIPNTIYIYGNKIAMLNTHEENPFGVLIENNELAETQRLLFEIIWEKAK